MARCTACYIATRARNAGVEHEPCPVHTPGMTVRLTARESVPVADLAAASLACRRYIAESGLGGSEWRGGAVHDGKRLVARVSYNGRVWGPGPWAPGQSPLLEPSDH